MTVSTTRSEKLDLRLSPQAKETLHAAAAARPGMLAARTPFARSIAVTDIGWIMRIEGRAQVAHRVEIGQPRSHHLLHERATVVREALTAGMERNHERPRLARGVPFRKGQCITDLAQVRNVLGQPIDTRPGGLTEQRRRQHEQDGFHG